MTTPRASDLRDAVASVLRDRAGLVPPYGPDEAFWQAAEADGVHLLVMAAARASGAVDAWPDHAVQRAKRAEADAATIQAMRERELTRVLGCLAAAGVPCLLMKGAALEHTHYARPHVRPRRDTDLLIPLAHAGAAVATLEAEGYARAPVETAGELVVSQYHFDRAEPRDDLHALDVHWRVSNVRVFGDGVDYDQLAVERMPVPALGPHAWTLAPAHALALACVHRVAHHWDSASLLWLMDIHVLASRLTAEEASAFVALASRWRMRAVCAHGLTRAAACFGTRGAQALIDGVRPPAGAVAEPSEEFIGGTLRLVDLLRTDLGRLNWRARVQLLREHVFPPRAYMRRIYARWPAPMLPLAYLDRTLRGAPRWLRRPRS